MESYCVTEVEQNPLPKSQTKPVYIGTKEAPCDSAYEMFSWYQYLIVGLVFSHLGFFEWESFAECTFS